MQKKIQIWALALLAVIGMVTQSAAETAQEIWIKKHGGGNLNAPIPIALTGYNGEVASTLKFDLEVANFDIVPLDKAYFELKGGYTGDLEGRLLDPVSKNQVFGKLYKGNNARSLAHALADDIVKEVTGRKGVAQTRVAFKVEMRPGFSEIFVSDYDGHNATPLTADNSLVAAPAWVQANKSIYYTSYKLGLPKIFSHNLATGERKIVAGYPGLNTSVAISPDGTKVAMVLSKNGSPDIYVANADGSNLKQLTHTRESESSPCWSPDGRKICFTSRMSGRAGLYVIPAAGGEIRRLHTPGVSNATEPDWSPDGKTIVFTALMRDFNICTVPATGGTATVVATGEDASWAANSRTVIFARRVGGRRVLSLLDVPSKRVKDIHQTAGSSSQPVWAR